jgi:hypothetical protein
MSDESENPLVLGEGDNAQEEVEVSQQVAEEAPPKSVYRLQHGATNSKIFVGGLAWETTQEKVKVKEFPTATL